MLLLLLLLLLLWPLLLLLLLLMTEHAANHLKRTHAQCAFTAEAHKLKA
jgi:hypothetical protein